MKRFSFFTLLTLMALLVSLPIEAKKKKKKNQEPPKSAYFQLTGRDSLEVSGVMNVIQKSDSFYLEIPADMLGRQFLVVNRFQKVPESLNSSGVNKGINYQNGVVRFEWDKKAKTVTIREQRRTPQVDKGDAIAQSVMDNYIDPILAVIKVKQAGPNDASVIIPANKLFNGKDDCLNDAFRSVNIPNSPNSELSRLISIKSHPQSVTGTSEFTAIVHEGLNRINVSVVVSSTLYLLPEKPMAGRLETSRVGYFTERQMQYSDSQPKVERLSYITRWRLEPTDKDAYLRGELVEPVKPIVFYLDQAIPASIRPYIKKGIEDWNPVFERAGFKNAVRALDVTDSIAAEDDDLKYSVLTYAASETANAMGPSITDPRSGEILEADVIWWHNVRRLLATWQKVQTGAVNPAVRQAVLPDSLLGDAARFVATHEVGHSLGLRHNMRASSAYPTDSLRSKTFTDRVGGTSASIMDYARYNYVAQPGDGVTQLAPHIGPYDEMAIEWGYRWYPDEEEAKPVLAKFLDDHKDKVYKYSETQSYRQALDPHSLTEDLGDDPVKSARYGVANLKRILPQIAEWSRTGEPGQSWEDVAGLWNDILAQWDLYNYHVLACVGGMYLENTVMGDGQQTFTYVEPERQRAAVQYLIDEVLTTPEWLFRNDFVKYTYLNKNRQEEHPLASVKNEQNYILWDLLFNDRLYRMMQAEYELGAGKSYSATDLINQLHNAIFTKAPQPDLLQRNVQKSYVDALITAAAEVEGVKINKHLYEGENTNRINQWICSEPECCVADHSLSSGPRTIGFTSGQISRNSDVISIKRGELMKIYRYAKGRAGNGANVIQMHFADMAQRIETALGLK